MYESGLSDHAARDQRSCLLAKRVIAQIVSNAPNPALGARQLDQRCALLRIHGQWFFTHHVLAGAQQSTGLLIVKMIGCANVYYVDAGIGSEFLEGSVCPR